MFHKHAAEPMATLDEGYGVADSGGEGPGSGSGTGEGDSEGVLASRRGFEPLYRP